MMEVAALEDQLRTLLRFIVSFVMVVETAMGDGLGTVQQFHNCSVTVKGPSPNTPCVFPFTFNHMIHHHCTDTLDPGNFWCSTETDPKGNHVPGKGAWGYCHPSCSPPKEDLQTQDEDAGNPFDESFTHDILAQPTTEASVINTTSDTLQMSTASLTLGLSAGIKKPARPNRKLSKDEDRTIWGDYLPTEEDLSCGLHASVGYIVGGSVAKRGEFPFMAILGYESQSSESNISYNCGGALINRRYVVTAAHCHVASQKFLQIRRVVLGEHDLTKDPDCELCGHSQVFDINDDDVTVHQDWVPSDVVSKGNDIALIRLPKLAVTVNEDPLGAVLPICLHLKFEEENRIPYLGDLMVAGWGRTNNDPLDVGDRAEARAFSKTLQKLKVSPYPVQKCKEIPLYRRISIEKHVCAGGDPRQDSCSGDSGGPLIERRAIDQAMYLVGIVSLGTRKCGQGFPGVYTNVSFYLNWIKENLQP